MAWSERRDNTRGTTWRVLWRQDGERKQVTFGTQAEADEFLAAVNLAGNRWPRGWIIGKGWAEDQPLDSDAPTFRDYAARTIDARPGADERTKDDYRSMFALHVNPVIGHLPIDTITRFDIAAVHQALRAKGRAHKTIANVHAALSSVFDDALQKEDPPLVRRNPAKGQLPKPESEDEDAAERVFLTKQEFAHLRNTIRDSFTQGDADLATFLAGTGMRWSEATALQVHDLDLLHRKTARVRRAWKRRGGNFILGRPKSPRSRRTISLSPGLVDLLLTYVAGKAPDEFVFTTVRGRPIRHANWYNRVWLPSVLRARQCDSHADPKGKPCGCPGTLSKQPSPHSLRHTHASWLIDEKVTLPAIQRRLGHESITTTINLYGHLVPEHAAEINDAVDRALSEGVTPVSPAALDASAAARTESGSGAPRR